jgi:16S rRNA (guanine527-N7)-methyltransferase
MENIDILKKGIEIYDIEVTSEMVERFDIYIRTLLEWNEKINLTAITDEKDIIIKHFLDSASCIQSGLGFDEKRVIDVGTGAGFPGIPLKIIVPGLELTLLDSLNKRVIFLSELMDRLGLKAHIIHGRAEDYGVKKEYREKYDIAVSRAVAAMNVLAEYTLPYVSVGGYLICQKGPSVNQEVEDAKTAIEVLGGNIVEISPTKIYNSELSHFIVKVKKIAQCPGKYPRKAGTAEKKPII